MRFYLKRLTFGNIRTLMIVESCYDALFGFFGSFKKNRDNCEGHVSMYQDGGDSV